MKLATASAVTTLYLADLAWAADYKMTLIETGKRDYYCTVTLQIENTSEEALADLNGHLISLVDADDVGRSKGGSFLNVTPGATASAEFETPNAPCDQITGYRFLVGACRVGTSFMDQGDCAERIETETPITEAVAR
ncbi:MAG: hypothetical protein AAGC99_11565 [Pseudomonadota bacterium]